MSQLLTLAVDEHTKTKKVNESSKLLKTYLNHPFLFYKRKYKGKILNMIDFVFLIPQLLEIESFVFICNSYINAVYLIPILQNFDIVIWHFMTVINVKKCHFMTFMTIIKNSKSMAIWVSNWPYWSQCCRKIKDFQFSLTGKSKNGVNYFQNFVLCISLYKLGFLGGPLKLIKSKNHWYICESHTKEHRLNDLLTTFLKIGGDLHTLMVSGQLGRKGFVWAT